MRHNANNDITHVEVEPLTDSLRACYGKSYFLEEHKALELQREGVIKVVDKEYLEQSDSFVDIMQQHADINSRREFKRLGRKPRIAWVQDQSNLGGAELSNLHTIKIGLDCGFDIVVITPNKFNKNTLASSDIVVLNNIFEFEREQFNDIFDVLFFQAKPFIKYDHDLRELNRLNVTRKVFEHSLINVFISPAHYKAYEDVYGKRLADRALVLPLAINTSIFFHDSGVIRKANTAVIPTFVKGVEGHMAYIRNHPEIEFTALRANWRFEEKNVHKIGHASLDHMAKLYRQHEYMVHLPTARGAGERVYFEAMLCGCKPIVNENVSHQSWKDYSAEDSGNEFKNIGELSEWLTNAPYKFWREVDAQARYRCIF